MYWVSFKGVWELLRNPSLEVRSQAHRNVVLRLQDRFRFVRATQDMFDLELCLESPDLFLSLSIAVGRGPLHIHKLLIPSGSPSCSELDLLGVEQYRVELLDFWMMFDRPAHRLRNR